MEKYQKNSFPRSSHFMNQWWRFFRVEHLLFIMPIISKWICLFVNLHRIICGLQQCDNQEYRILSISQYLPQMNNYFPINSDRSEYNRILQQKNIDSNQQMGHANPLNRTLHKRNIIGRTTPSQTSEGFSRGSENITYPQFSTSNVDGYSTTPRSLWRSTQIDPSSNSEQKMNSVLERLTILQSQVFKIKDSNRDRSPTFRNKEMVDLKQLYKLIREHKKIQSKINEDNYQEVQGLKKNIKTVKQSLQTIVHKFIDKKQKKQKLFTFQQLQVPLENINKKEDTQIVDLRKQISQLNQNIEEMKKSLTNNLYEQRISALSGYYKQGEKISENKTAFKVKNEEYICGKMGKTIKQEGRQKKEQVIKTRELVYYIDQDGYLLDEEMHYLLNERNQMIKVRETQLAILRQKCNLIE